MKTWFKEAFKEKGYHVFEFPVEEIPSEIPERLNPVKELLGHKSIEMTLRYAHLAQSHKKSAVENLDRALNAKERFRACGEQAE